MDLVDRGLPGFSLKFSKTQIDGDTGHTAHQHPCNFPLCIPMGMTTEGTDDLTVPLKRLLEQLNLFTGIELPRIFRLPHFKRRMMHENSRGP